MKELVVRGCRGGWGREERARREDAAALVIAEEEDDRNDKREERWMAHLSVRERERRG